MGGKAILILVLGFSFIFLIMEKNIGSATTRTVGNMADYHANITAHNIAVSGANIAANKMYLDESWRDGYSNINYQGGKINVTVDVLDVFRQIIRINSIGSFRGIADTVQVTLQPSKFSKFAYYSESEGVGQIWWTTGDTVWGPFHTQDQMNIDGSPVFMGKVTTKDPLNLRHLADPKFLGGFEQGVDLQMPSNNVGDLRTAAQTGGKYISGQDEVFIEFAGDDIIYKYQTTTSSKKKKKKHSTQWVTETIPAATFAPNGVIFVDDAKVNISGTVKGKYTISSGGNGQQNKGNIFLEDDIVYNSNPLTDPQSTDMLGIVAENNVYISDNNANSDGINIDAAIYAQEGGFGAENYSSRGPSGSINLLGGITQKVRLPVGTFNWRGVVSGFTKSYRYDDRLMSSFPPSFPSTGFFEIVSWYE